MTQLCITFSHFIIIFSFRMFLEYLWQVFHHFKWPLIQQITMAKTNSSYSMSNASARVSVFLSNMRYEHLLAGISGGVASTLILHPLDLIKIRFAGMNLAILLLWEGVRRTMIFIYVSIAVSDGQLSIRPQYSGLYDALCSITRSEGIRGLYRGVAPNICGAGFAWGSYFFL